jgi:hypothetical protein
MAYTYFLDSTKPSPPTVRRFIVYYLKQKKDWKESAEEDALFTHRYSTGKMRFGFTHLDYSLIGNKEKNNEIFGKAYYYPETHLFNVNRDLEWEKKARKIILDSKEDVIWFLKPKFGGQGKGIVLLNKNSNLDNLNKKTPQQTYILQKGVANIHLHQNAKYDLRVHVIFVKNHDKIIPLFYQYADVRIAPKSYDNTRLELRAMLTYQQDGSHILMSAKDIPEYQKYFPNLKKVITDSSKQVCIELKKQIKKWENTVEFWITGFDIIMDNKGQFFVLEFNESPNLFQKRSIYSQHRQMIKSLVDQVIDPLAKNKKISKGDLIILE